MRNGGQAERGGNGEGGVVDDDWGATADAGAREARAAALTKKKKEKHDREEIFAALVKLGYEPSYHVLDGRCNR